MNTPKEGLVTREYRYTILFEPAEGDGFTITCPALPGVVAAGDTREKARALAVDAIRCYLESLAKDGMPFPVEEELEALPIREMVTVQLTEG